MKNYDINNEKQNYKWPQIFDFLTGEEQEYLKQNMHIVRFRRGETILKQGAPFNHVKYLISGLAKIHLMGIDGSDIILKLLKPNELFVGPGLYVNNTYHFSLTAIENSDVCYIDREAIRSIIHKNPQFTETFLTESHLNLSQAYEKLITLNQRNARGRVADVFLYLAKNIFVSENFTVNLSKSELAEMAGISKESFYKILNEFEQDNLVRIKGHDCEVLNRNRLEAIRENG
jgi:CRP-like cAMP-binding protein